MIVVDVNLLLYATFTTFEQHAAARRWFEGVLNSLRSKLGSRSYTFIFWSRVRVTSRSPSACCGGSALRRT